MSNSAAIAFARGLTKPDSADTARNQLADELRGKFERYRTPADGTVSTSAGSTSDPATVAFLRRLEHRGIGKYIEPSAEGKERAGRMAIVAELDRRIEQNNRALARARGASPNQEGKEMQGLSLCEQMIAGLHSSDAAPITTPAAGHIPLNGMGVINAMRQALTGSGGTVTVEQQ